ncbi:hypothetical protein JNW91_15780 [Micromonospora sp. STR1_7]|uniref:Uncharacterized protein n=1 Tax=Micromonospora parastrephiae TaxID=2806101 RepID=A0ABS1XVC7_9ACTN|nr:hypothetical protein [Micromonospora parastrephiae]MBM0233195.1 hypothetical protein [Micromonospora parastrephiae]
MAPPRNPLRLADGRVLYGRWPQSMPTTGEGPYIAALARQVKGVPEVVLPVGRADVATAATVFEVEPARQWRTAIRQVLGYAGQTGLAPAIALFGPEDYLHIYLFVRDRLPGLGLWVYRGRWEQVTSRKSARLKHHPSYVIVP